MIYLIVGKSGAGKTTIVKRLIKECDIKPIITCTTRPQRQGEKDGVDYNFISYEKFMELLVGNEFLEWTSYLVANGETWYYGSLIKDFETNEDRIIIVNPEGLKKIKKACKEQNIKVKTILFDCNPVTRQGRLLDRGDDLNEMKRRLQTDERDFKDIDKLIDITINTDDHSIENIVYKIKKIINRRRKLIELQNLLVRWYDRIIGHRTKKMA